MGSDDSRRKRKQEATKHDGNEEDHSASMVERQQKKKIKLSKTTIARLLESDDDAGEPATVTGTVTKTSCLKTVVDQTADMPKVAGPNVITRSAGKLRDHLTSATQMTTLEGEKVRKSRKRHSSAPTILDTTDAAKRVLRSTNSGERGFVERVQNLSAGEDAGITTKQGKSRKLQSIEDELTTPLSTPPAFTTETFVAESINAPAIVKGRRGRGAVQKDNIQITSHPSPVIPTPSNLVKENAVRGKRGQHKRIEPLELAFGTGGTPEPSSNPSPITMNGQQPKRRKREETCVLFSHGLDEETIKQQRKVL